MARYRKKPVVIKAFRTDGEVPGWFLRALHEERAYYDADDLLVIKTLNGAVRVDPGEWVVQGVKGEIYPCRPDIFEQTYEEVGDGE